MRMQEMLHFQVNLIKEILVHFANKKKITIKY